MSEIDTLGAEAVDVGCEDCLVLFVGVDGHTHHSVSRRKRALPTLEDYDREGSTTLDLEWWEFGGEG